MYSIRRKGIQMYGLQYIISSNNYNVVSHTNNLFLAESYLVKQNLYNYQKRAVLSVIKNNLINNVTG